MKKILGLAFAGALLIACGSSNRNSSAMQGSTTPTNPENMPANGDQTGGDSSMGGMGNTSGSSTGPTGSSGDNSEQQGSQGSNPTNNP